MAGRGFTQRADGSIEVRTTRSVWFAVGAGPGLTLLWLLGVVAPAAGDRHTNGGALAALTALVIVAGGAVAWRSLAVEFVERDGALTVRNTFRTHRFAWVDVGSFAVRKMGWRGDHALVLRSRSGSDLVVHATVTRSPEHLKNLLATVRARAEAHHVRVEGQLG